MVKRCADRQSRTDISNISADRESFHWLLAGINLLMKDALMRKRKVEIFMILSKEIEAPVKGLYKSIIMKVNPFHEMETMCKKDYFDVEGEFPEWNYQERRQPWPDDFQKRHADYISSTLKKIELIRKK